MNIGPPRDTMAAQDCEDGLRLYLMNQPGWPPGEGAKVCRPTVVWPTLKSYRWMRQFGDNQHGNRNGITSKEPPRDSA